MWWYRAERVYLWRYQCECQPRPPPVTKCLSLLRVMEFPCDNPLSRLFGVGGSSWSRNGSELANFANTKCQFSLTQECQHQAQDYVGLQMLAATSAPPHPHPTHNKHTHTHTQCANWLKKKGIRIDQCGLQSACSNRCLSSSHRLYWMIICKKYWLVDPDWIGWTSCWMLLNK